MALALRATHGDHHRVMTPQLIALATASTPPHTSATRAVLIWGDDTHARRLWAAALADEGLIVDTRVADDLSLPQRLADAWVLHISSSLSAHLGRLRALRTLGDVPPLMVAAHAVRDLARI